MKRLAESPHGREIYILHDNGRKLFTSPQDCVPLARRVYLAAKSYHEEQQREEAERKQSRRSNMPASTRTGTKF